MSLARVVKIIAAALPLIGGTENSQADSGHVLGARNDLSNAFLELCVVNFSKPSVLSPNVIDFKVPVAEMQNCLDNRIHVSKHMPAAYADEVEKAKSRIRDVCPLQAFTIASANAGINNGRGVFNDQVAREMYVACVGKALVP